MTGCGTARSRSQRRASGVWTPSKTSIIPPVRPDTRQRSDRRRASPSSFEGIVGTMATSVLRSRVAQSSGCVQQPAHSGDPEHTQTSEAFPDRQGLSVASRCNRSRRPPRAATKQMGPYRRSSYGAARSASSGSQAWARYSEAKAPARSMSVSKVPCSAMPPWRSTTIRSALRMVDSRCAMMNVVRPA